MQKKSQKFTLSYFYESKEEGQNQPPAIKYKSKKHPIKRNVKISQEVSTEIPPPPASDEIPLCAPDHLN